MGADYAAVDESVGRQMQRRQTERTMEQRIREALVYHQEQVARLSAALVYIEQNREGAEALLTLLAESNSYSMGLGRI